MSKISVIIPVYNVEKYLSRCLDSVTKQTFQDIEIICINDGSTDNSLKILENYAQQDKRIKIISQKNSGLSVARNTGLKNVHSEYVSFIDSDDWIDIEYYEYMYNLAITKNADMVICAIRTVNGQKISDANTNNLITDNLNDKLQNLSTGSICNALFKTSLFKQHKLIFPINRYYEDNTILLKTIYYSGKTVFTNTVSYYYFMNENGICKTPDISKYEKKCNDRIYFANEMMKFAKEHKFEKQDVFKKFLLNTVIFDFISKKSPYYKQTKKILGYCYVFKLRLKKFINKIVKNFYRKTDKNIKVFGIKIKKIKKPEQPCIIGKYTYYGENFSVFNKLSHIGSYCSVGKNVQIGTSSHFMNILTTSPITTPDICFMNFPKPTNSEWINHRRQIFNLTPLLHQQPVSVGNDVWIGNNAIIMDGVRIGHGAIIGSGAVVTHDVPPYAIVGGVPAKIIKYRFDKKTIKDLLELQWWNLNEKDISDLPFMDLEKCKKIMQKLAK